MSDETPVHITALFLILSAGSLIPYLLEQMKSPYGKRLDISAGGFLILAFEIIFFGLLFFTSLGPSHVLLTVALALGISISLLHPVPAICFFVSLLFLRPWEVLPDNPLLKLLPRLMAALTSGAWLLDSLRHNKSTFILGRPGILFGALLTWIASSCLASMTPGASFKVFFESFLPTAVLSFLILNSLKDGTSVRAFSRSFVISGLGIICVAFYVTGRDYTSGASDFRLHSSGLWGNSNDLAALAVIMLPISLMSLRKKARSRHSGLALVASLLFLTAVLWSQSRAAQAAMLIAGISYSLFSGFGLRFGLLLVPSAVIISLIAAAMPQRDITDTAGSSESRYNYVIAGLRMAREHPIFGVGVGNYPHLYEQYTPAFIECGNRTAHSTWVLILSETGYGGLLLLGWLYGSVVARAWRIRVCAPEYILSMITYGIVMSVLSHTYLFLPYVFMAFVLSASLVHLRSTQKEIQSDGNASDHSQVTVNRPTTLGRIAMIVLVCGYPITVITAEECTSLTALIGLEPPDDKAKHTTTDSITLQGSRGEILSFLMKAEGSGCIPIVLTTESTTANRPSPTISMFDLPKVKTQHPSFTGARVGSYLDPAIPLHTPLSICLSKEGHPHWVLGEVELPTDLPPGSYKAIISSGKKSLTINITVWPMIMPERPALAAYSELTPWFLVLGHYGKWHQDEARLTQLYSEEMIRHRVIPLKVTIAPLKERLDRDTRILDIESTPTRSSSFRSVVLHNRPSWAYYDFPSVGANGSKKIDYSKAESYFEAINNTIPKIKPENRALVYLWDEPKKDAFPELLKLSQLARRKAPSLKQLVTTPYSALLRDSVDIFAPVMNHYDTSGFPPPVMYREWKLRGNETWWYVSCMSHGCEALRDTGVPDMVIDRAASYIRVIGWLSMRYSIDSFLYYSVNNGFQESPKRDPWESLWDFSGNGDGTLFYPGRPGEHGVTTHQPIASLRLKRWRESSYDAEYIKWMNELTSKPPWWNSELEGLARSTTSWSRDYSSYQHLRDRAGEYLSRRLSTDGVSRTPSLRTLQ